MKPLILWARAKHPNPYSLRLSERTPETIGGEVKIDNQWLPFRYDRHALIITIGEDTDPLTIHIDEWGWEQ